MPFQPELCCIGGWGGQKKDYLKRTLGHDGRSPMIHANTLSSPTLKEAFKEVILWIKAARQLRRPLLEGGASC